MNNRINKDDLEDCIHDILDVLLLEWGSELEPDIDFYTEDEKERIGKGGTIDMLTRVLAHDIIAGMGLKVNEENNV